jgi:dihydroflavonol-4-reductase
MEIAVTGASGHIGSNLCRRLLEEGHRLRAQYQHFDLSLADLALDARAGDVRDRAFVRDLVDGADVVFHLAARISIAGDPNGDVWQTNVEGTRNVAEVSLEAGVRRLVHFSSIHAFDQSPRDEPLDEGRASVGPSAFVYDRSKLAGERIVFGLVNRGLDAVILNPTAVVGPLDMKPSDMGGVLHALARGRMPFLVDGGFDWVDVRDVVSAAVAAVRSGRTGQRYLLSGAWTSLADVAALVDEAVGRRRTRWVLPIGLARAFVPVVGAAARLAGSPPVFTGESLAIVGEGNRKIRHDLAGRELGFRARPLPDTIRDTIQWFASKAT